MKEFGMILDKGELLILLESLNHFQNYVTDKMFSQEIKDLREKIRSALS